MLIAGIDEAGRGPVIGPMVFAVVVMDEKDEKKLHTLGVTDSKLLDHKTRDTLFDEVKKAAVEYKILSLSASDITEWMKSASLNDVEAIKTAELLDLLKATPDVVYVDCPDTVPARYAQNIKNLTKKKIKIIAEHKADLNYKVAGAASILAKVTRDREIEELAKEYGNIGSGYPSDEVTQRWIDECWKKNKSFPDCVRKKWATAERKAQTKLGEY